MMENFTWFGQSSFAIVDQISGNKIYYIDPWNMPPTEVGKADIVFITHAHFDHLSPNDLYPLLKPDSVVIATLDCLEKLADIKNEQKQAVAPLTFYTVKGVSFSTIPAYNIHPDKLKFHPKENGWVGYILTVNNKKIYHAGDTDFTPELKDLKKENLDIALLPIGGIYTMDVDEAIKAANEIRAKITIPMHFRDLLKDKSDEAVEKFRKGVKNSEVVVLQEFE